MNLTNKNKSKYLNNDEFYLTKEFELIKLFNPNNTLVEYNLEGVKINVLKKQVAKIQKEEILLLHKYLNYEHQLDTFSSCLDKFRLNNTKGFLSNDPEGLTEFERFVKNNDNVPEIMRNNLIGTYNKTIDISSPFKNNYTFLMDVLFNSIEHFETITTQNFRNCEFIPAARHLSPKRQYVLKEGDYFENLIFKFSSIKTFQLGEFQKKANEILAQFGIADNIIIEFNTDRVAYGIFLKDPKGRTRNLADYGHGISQLLPTVLGLVLTNLTTPRKKNNEDLLIIIEEPETNLHPALQSRLADLFVYLKNEFGFHFLIETHSEYLIRKLQLLTVTNATEIDREDIQIYYFYPPDAVPEGEKQILSITIDKDGSLSKNFGTGFFDESSNLNMELFLKNKFSQN